jgi:sulfite reductase (NADPH) flavoprotein alpha-component
MNIYYGSQSGNCEEIARILQYRIKDECQLVVSCNPLNSFASSLSNDLSNNQKVSTVFIITSTYGNGESPFNANQFERILKNRNLPTNQFEWFQYAVLALGDSNYNLFCNFGKLVDRRIQQNKGKRIMELVCIDDVSDLEEQVNKWCDRVIDYIHSIQS